MEPGLEELRKNYKSFSDDKLVHLATQDAYGLRPEAVQALKEEITARGLSTDLLKGIEIQRKPIDEKEMLEYCRLLSKLPCPVCGTTSQQLNAIITAHVMSILVMTTYEKKVVIACPACLRKANNDAIVNTSLLGWWGFPWGVIRTVQAIIFNSKMSAEADSHVPNDALKGFVLAQIGTIEANKDNTPRLKELVKNLN